MDGQITFLRSARFGSPRPVPVRRIEIGIVARFPPPAARSVPLHAVDLPIVGPSDSGCPSPERSEPRRFHACSGDEDPTTEIPPVSPSPGPRSVRVCSGPRLAGRFFVYSGARDPRREASRMLAAAAPRRWTCGPGGRSPSTTTPGSRASPTALAKPRPNERNGSTCPPHALETTPPASARCHINNPPRS